MADELKRDVPVPLPGRRNILITSALPYVNNTPHLGNIIGCVASADVYSRFARARGYNTIYICGTDEYGTATETKAKKEGVTPQEICERYHKLHKAIYKWFDIDFDHFGRTSTEQQTKITQDIFRRLDERGCISEKEVVQLFCTKCDTPLADRFVIGECPKCHYDNARGDQCDSCAGLLNADELINPKCSTCDSSPERRQTRHLYLGLQHLTPKLEAWFKKSSTEGKWSSNSTTTTQGWINKGLLDRCITRDLKWGTPVPPERKGFENKVFYVWFDAPIGYLSITACLTDQWEKWWKSNKDDDTKVELYQSMGKDNVPFHTVIFPSTLLGADDDYTMLHHINTTEYLMYESGKFSKSRSTGVFGDDAERTGIPASVWRYYLFTNRPETSDSDFTWPDLQAKCNSELNDNLGNFVNRTIAFTKTKFGGVVPNMKLQQIDRDFVDSVRPLVKQYIDELEAVKIKNGLRTTMAISKLANAYLQTKEPWKHIKKNSTDEEKEGAATTMAVCIQVVRLLAYLIQPYMPAISDKIAEQLNIPKEFPLTETALDMLAEENLLGGHEVGTPEVLFKKITNEQIVMLKRNFMGKDQLAAAQGIPVEGAGPEFPLDLVVGKVVDVVNHPTAEHLWITQVQLGERKLQVVTNIRTQYEVDDFKGKSVVVITNIKKSKFQGETSEAMLLAAVADDGTTSLVTTTKPHGTRVTPKGATIKVKKNFKYKKAFKALEGRTDESSVPMFLDLPLEAAGERVTLDKPLPGVKLQ